MHPFGRADADPFQFLSGATFATLFTISGDPFQLFWLATVYVVPGPTASYPYYYPYYGYYGGYGYSYPYYRGYYGPSVSFGFRFGGHGHSHGGWHHH